MKFLNDMVLFFFTFWVGEEVEEHSTMCLGWIV